MTKKCVVIKGTVTYTAFTDELGFSLDGVRVVRENGSWARLPLESDDLRVKDFADGKLHDVAITVDKNGKAVSVKSIDGVEHSPKSSDKSVDLLEGGF